jgi:hypothetical protein
LPNATVNRAYSALLSATSGTTPYQWTITSGALPAGLTLDATSGSISGNPRAAGTRTFTVQVTDANSQAATATLTLTVSRRH